ncbi:ATPase family AAA domain-containing protein 2B [Sciurus carolinensis]|uniref:ATPase family AAA domain-containing protein 2B n=1 Tax=Sciurus carolinensis TaxID=30640 RepID=A0AA41MZ46_SCICA|nr:ATPase family AAA domain-containing protein 2B [Sciurus carolinensis]
MVNTRKSSLRLLGSKSPGPGPGPGAGAEPGATGGSSHFISSRTRSSKTRAASCPAAKAGGSSGAGVALDEARKAEVDGSLSDSHVSPPAKRTLKQPDSVCKDKSKSRSTGQREEWNITTGQTSTAEAVLQEMDNINIRRNRRSGEVERLRMWTDTEFENMDMYSRVKRRRKSLRRNSYGIQNHHEVSTEGEEEESQEEDGDIEVEEAEGEENDRPYNLRQRKTVDRYQAPPIVPSHQKKRENTLFDIHRSPARRSHIRRKKHAIHSSDTTSSDEERFERRKSKSMARARNRCLPMNFRAEDLASGILRERVKVGASLADVDPMNIDKSARKHILQIHTRDWNPKLSDAFLGELAEKCVGYCGADIKALCTEAALIALRRRYPQIYASSHKLQLDVSSIVLSAQDFYHAMQNIVPASQRAVMSSGHALSPIIRPLLERSFNNILAVLQKVFPHAEISQSDKKEGHHIISQPLTGHDYCYLEKEAQIFREARRTVPSIVYMPHIGDWWEAVSETVRATFLTLLQDIPSFSPIFLLSTSETMYSELPEEVKCIFRIQYEEVLYIQRPIEEDRRKFFQELILNQASMPPPRRKHTALCAMEVLPLALPSPPRQLSESEKNRMEDQEENTLRELRLFLRDVTKRLATDKRFNIFSKPVDIEEVSDYLEVIKEPMDLSTVITKIDKHNYLTAKDFLQDIDLICSNALEYNPDKDPGDKIIRHRACTLKDTAHAIIAAELDPEFNKLCEEIKEARIKRGLSVTAEQINPHGTGTRKTETRVEEAFRHKQRNPMDVWHNSANKCAFRVRRKSRRRSQWGKGIIKKRKVNNLKKDEEDTKFADYENHTEDRKLLENGEFEVSTDCHEENGEETGDLSMTNDESSCDIMDMDQGQRLNNGAGTKENFASTEEESSNESLLIHGSGSLNPEQTSRKEPFLKGNCLNGEASTDSFEGIPVLECQNGKVDVVPLCGSGDKCSSEQKIVLESQSKGKPETSNENHGDDPEKLEALECSNTEKLEPGPEVEVKDAELDKEGASKVKKYRKLILEQAKTTSLELVPEEPSEPVPPLIVDRERLKKLLDLLVDKSNNLTVDQLERLYSLLSQCIYRHRKDYDKSQLVELIHKMGTMPPMSQDEQQTRCHRKGSAPSTESPPYLHIESTLVQKLQELNMYH